MNIAGNRGISIFLLCVMFSLDRMSFLRIFTEEVSRMVTLVLFK